MDLSECQYAVFESDLGLLKHLFDMAALVQITIPLPSEPFLFSSNLLSVEGVDQ